MPHLRVDTTTDTDAVVDAAASSAAAGMKLTGTTLLAMTVAVRKREVSLPCASHRAGGGGGAEGRSIFWAVGASAAAGAEQPKRWRWQHSGRGGGERSERSETTAAGYSRATHAF